MLPILLPLHEARVKKDKDFQYLQEDIAEIGLQRKKNLRLLKTLKTPLQPASWDLRSVGSESFLLQQRDLKETTMQDLKVVTQRPPTDLEMKAMLFGCRS